MAERELQGWFYKRASGFPHNWKRRYWVIRNQILLYYSSEEDDVAKGFVVLEGAQVRDGDGDTGKEFSLAVSQMRGRKFYCRFDTDEERQQWLGTVMDVIEQPLARERNLIAKEQVLRKERNALVDRVAELEEALRNEQAQRAKMEVEYHGLESRLSSQEAERAKMQERISYLESETVRLKQVAHDLREQTVGSDSQLESIKAERDAAVTRAQALATRLTESATQLRDTRDKNAKYKAERNALLAEVKNMLAEKKQREQELLRAQQQIASLMDAPREAPQRSQSLAVRLGITSPAAATPPRGSVVASRGSVVAPRGSRVGPRPPRGPRPPTATPPPSATPPAATPPPEVIEE